MTTRKWLGLIASVLALAAGMPASAADQSNRQGCSPLGSWFGFDTTGTALWTSTFHGTSSSGTYALEIPGLSPSAFFPTAVRVSTFRGMWQSTGGNTIAVTVISLALDAAGQTVGIAKINASDKLTDNCNTLLITNTLELFAPNVNPFESEPYAVIPLADHSGYRMRVDLQAN